MTLFPMCYHAPVLPMRSNVVIGMNKLEWNDWNKTIGWLFFQYWNRTFQYCMNRLEWIGMQYNIGRK